MRAGLDGAEVKAPRCPAAAEFRARGPRAGLQLQHLRGLPKGEPLESSVRKAGAVLKVKWSCLWALTLCGVRGRSCVTLLI